MTEERIEKIRASLKSVERSIEDRDDVMSPDAWIERQFYQEDVSFLLKVIDGADQGE